MVSLLDNKLNVIAFSETEKVWISSSMEDPLGGILANPWSQRITSIDREASVHDFSYIHLNQHFLMGGHPKRQAELKTQNVIHFRDLTFEHNETIFTRFTSAACGITLEKGILMLFGGIDFDSKQPINTIMTINVTTQTVELQKGMLFSRCYHSCEILNETFLFISGGFSDPKNPGSSIVPDEIYNRDTGESQQVSSSLGRYDHRLIRLQDSIFALGGRVASRSPVSKVEKFESSSSSWSRHPEDLLSTTPGRLAVTVFPVSALDCQECSCGGRKSARIIEGVDAEVCMFFIFHDKVVMFEFPGRILSMDNGPFGGRRYCY